jgi:hypothetical protein
VSLAELQNEIAGLTPSELKLVRAMVEAEMVKKEASPQTDTAQYLGCTRGMMQFHPGWEEDESPESWEALRDDPPL